MKTIRTVLVVGIQESLQTSAKCGLGLHCGTYKLVLTDHSDAWTPGWLANSDLKYGITPRLAIGVE